MKEPRTTGDDRPTARIFVVDDEQQICALLERLLSREGHQVTAFDKPEDALAAVDRERPDLLVTDMMMPGMSGLELIERVREKLPEIGVVVITGYASIDTVVDALRRGVDDFVTKPFSVAEIRSVTARLLEERPPRTTALAAPATSSPASGIRVPGGPSGTLARRLAEMSLRERVHALLGDMPSSQDVLPRLADLFRNALNVSHAALLVPSTRGSAAGKSALELHTTTAGRPLSALRVPRDTGWVKRASEEETTVTRRELGPLDAVLDVGPPAAAPLLRRRGRGATTGLLVVTRPAGAEEFDRRDLSRLAVAAIATGDVIGALRATERAEDAYVDTLAAIVTATEVRTPCFARHSERVRDLSLQLGRRVGLSDEDMTVIDSASRLLDLGRIQIPDELLAKTAPPSPDEWQVLRQHVSVADTLLRPVGRLRHMKPVIRHHHENWDGSGYPDGLQGQEIPYLAALVRVTDAFAALTSPRAWRAALSPDEAIGSVRELAGQHFHPDLAEAFADMVEMGVEES